MSAEVTEKLRKKIPVSLAEQREHNLQMLDRSGRICSTRDCLSSLKRLLAKSLSL